MSGKKVLFIDDAPAARDSYVLELEDIFGDEVEVLTTPPLGTIDEMLGDVLDQPQLVSLIVDERLDDTGAADYKGIELASEVRPRLPKLPIYILTNYPDDIVDGGFNIEYVLDKNELLEDEYKKTVSARVRRHINVFDDILVEREQRYAELLPKFLGGTLTEEENSEFLQLEASRIKPLSHEFVDNDELKKRLDEQDAILRDLREGLEKDS